MGATGGSSGGAGGIYPESGVTAGTGTYSGGSGYGAGGGYISTKNKNSGAGAPGAIFIFN